METLVRIVDDEETVRNSEIFIFKLAGIPAAAYSSAEEFLAKDDLTVRAVSFWISECWK